MLHFVVAIDPGLMELGIVLMLDGKVLAYATYTSPKGRASLSRVVAMADEIVSQIAEWVYKYEIKHVDICIEYPIYNGNPKIFEIQIRLMQELETGFLHVVAGLTEECWLTRVNPKQVKRLATGVGNADKTLVVKAGPFDWKAGIADESIEALSDAWAASLAGWEKLDGAPRILLSNMTAARIKRNIHHETNNPERST